MTRVFADTWFYLATLNPADPNHARSVALARAERRRRVTTDWVLVEVGDALARTSNRDVFSDFYKWIRSDSGTTVVPATRLLLEDAVQFYRYRRDKNWPLWAGRTRSAERSHYMVEYASGYRAGWRMGQPKFSAGIGAFPKNAFFQQPANALVLRQLAAPLPSLEKNFAVSVLASRLSEQVKLLKTRGFTEDYVHLQLTLAQTEASYAEAHFAKRIEELYYFVSDIEDRSIRASSLALIDTPESHH